MEKILILITILLSNFGLIAQCNIDASFEVRTDFSIGCDSIRFEAIDQTDDLIHYWNTQNKSLGKYPNAAHKFSENGTFIVEHYVYSKSGNCADTAYQEVVINCDISDSTFSENLIIEIYPNPSFGVFSINSSKYVNYIISTLNGNIIYQSNNEFNNSIDLSGEPTGLYLLKIVTLDQVITRTLVKK